MIHRPHVPPTKPQPRFRSRRRAAAGCLLVAAFAQVAPAAAQHEVRMQLPAAEMTLDFPTDRAWVEVPFRLEMSKIVVPIRVNDSEPLDFVFDTGAAGSVLLDSEAAARIELDVVGQARIQGAGTTVEARMADLAGGVRFGIGDLTLAGGTMVVLQGSLERELHRWQGIIGRQILDHLVVEIDWAGERIRFADPTRYQVPAEADALPLASRHGHLFVGAEVAVDGGPPRTVELVIDSGASHALALDQRRFDTVPATRVEEVTLGRGLGGEIKGSIGRVREVRLGSARLRDVVTSFPEAAAADIITSGSDGNLGAEILRRFVVTLDTSRDRLVLRPTAALAEPFAFSTAGFSVRSHLTDEGHALVENLYPESPASRAGLAEGDLIVAIDGRSPAEIDFGQLQALLEQAPGTALSLEVRRGEVERTIELTLERLL